jgi:hypothetical protein
MKFFVTLFLCSNLCADLCVVELATGKIKTISREKRFEEILWRNAASGEFTYALPQSSGLLIRTRSLFATNIIEYAIGLPTQTLVFYAGGSGWHYALSPDRRGIAYYDESKRKIMLAAVGEAEPKIILGAKIYSWTRLGFLDWISDDKVILGVSDIGKALSGVFEVQVKARQGTEVYGFEGVEHGNHVCRASQKVAFMCEDEKREHAIVILDGLNNWKAIKIPVKQFCAKPISWDKNGEIFYYQDNNEVLAFETKSQTKTRLFEMPGNTFIFDCDGKSIIYKYQSGSTKSEYYKSLKLYYKSTTEQAVEKAYKVRMRAHGYLMNNSQYVLVECW